MATVRKLVLGALCLVGTILTFASFFQRNRQSTLRRPTPGDNEVLIGQPLLADPIEDIINAANPVLEFPDDSESRLENGLQKFDYREVFSQSTKDRKFLSMYLGLAASNTNIIPHPTKADLWVVVAQHAQESSTIDPSSGEVVCEAGMINDGLICTETAKTLELDSHVSTFCEGDLSFLRLIAGPRDARVFMGPDKPYVVYGSQSNYICFGQWMQDARVVLDSFKLQAYMHPPDFYATSTELKRPTEFNSSIEKNYFLFWDSQGQMYAHYNLWPERSFAKLEIDGSGVADLAPATAHADQSCMAKYMPSDTSPYENIHQATNSLSITLCKRTDTSCVPDDTNTFIMHIFHHKSYHNFHGIYEPFVMLMQRNAPFAIHAISRRPFWIHGRGPLTFMSDAYQYRNDPGAIPDGHSEMFYITSMSWKSHLQKYHGYIDDVLFVAFGIEDSRPGVIDVLAGDLLQDLAYCS